MTLNAWDFGGQGIYRVTDQFFFTRRAVYLVLWNVRAGPTQGAVDFWLQTIRQRVGDNAGSVGIVAGTDGWRERHRSAITMGAIPKGGYRDRELRRA